MFALHKSLNLERRNPGPKSPYLCLILTTLTLLSTANLNIKAKKVWVPLDSRSLEPIHILGVGPALGTKLPFSFPPSNKIFCSSKYFLSEFLPNAILFDFHQAALRKGDAEPSILIPEHQLSGRSRSRRIFISSNHAFNRNDWRGAPSPTPSFLAH